MKKSIWKSGYHNYFLIIAIYTGFVFFQNVSKYFLTDYNVLIIKIDLVCQQPLNNRCNYEWIGKEINGETKAVDLSAFCEENVIAVGDRINKKKLSLNFQLNGNDQGWPGGYFYLKFLIASVVSFIIWLYFVFKRDNVH
jgi:hypothetical protein